jgi:hypothetical protein
MQSLKKTISYFFNPSTVDHDAPIVSDLTSEEETTSVPAFAPTFVPTIHSSPSPSSSHTETSSGSVFGAKVVRPSEVPEGPFKDYLNTYYFGNFGKQQSSANPVDKINIFNNSGSRNVPENAHVNQVLFLLDATGSMGSFIEGTKQEIRNLMQTMKDKGSEAAGEFPMSFQVAVLAYRDFTDKRHFETLDFTDDVNLIESFLSSIKADGGGDSPEDVKGSFIHALFGIDQVNPILSWDESKDCASKSIIWLADASPHGDKFYGPHGDNFPDKNYKEWSDIFDEIKRLDADLYAMKITSYTDKTNAYFKESSTERQIEFYEVDISQSVNKYNPATGRRDAFSSREAYTEMAEVMCFQQSAKMVKKSAEKSLFRSFK